MTRVDGGWLLISREGDVEKDKWVVPRPSSVVNGSRESHGLGMDMKGFVHKKKMAEVFDSKENAKASLNNHSLQTKGVEIHTALAVECLP